MKKVFLKIIAALLFFSPVVYYIEFEKISSVPFQPFIVYPIVAVACSIVWNNFKVSEFALPWKEEDSDGERGRFNTMRFLTLFAVFISLLISLGLSNDHYGWF